MPRATSLAFYAVKIRNVPERDDEVLSSFGDEESDFLEFANKRLTKLQREAANDEEAQQVLKVNRLHQEDRQLYGIIETGEYGVESELVDVVTNRLAHKRQKTEADMMPFYFLFDIPEEVDEGILLIQRSGVLGIRKLLHRVMAPNFEEEFADLKLRFSPLVEAGELEKYVRGAVEQIRFIRFGRPADIVEAYDQGHREEDVVMEFVIRARRGKSIPINTRIRRFFGQNTPVRELFALQEVNFPYDDIKVKSRVGNSTRTIDLASPENLRSYRDITAEVRLDRNGHPRFDSIHQIAQRLMGEIKGEIYGGAQ